MGPGGVRGQLQAVVGVSRVAVGGGGGGRMQQCRGSRDVVCYARAGRVVVGPLLWSLLGCGEVNCSRPCPCGALRVDSRVEHGANHARGHQHQTQREPCAVEVSFKCLRHCRRHRRPSRCIFYDHYSEKHPTCLTRLHATTSAATSSHASRPTSPSPMPPPPSMCRPSRSTATDPSSAAT